MPSEEPLNKRVRTDMNNETTFELDLNTLNKFSRQNATFGAETTAKLIKMKVIVYGLRGIGAETSKNLALQGVGSITLIDSAPVDIKDLGVNFFFSESDVTSGVSRAETFSIKLKELNPLCDVKVCSHLSPEILAKHTALVICNPTIQKSELINLNEACRKLGTSFFYAFTGGLFTSIFVDHGEKHIVNDPDGEKPLQKLITNITSTENINEFLIRYDTPEGQVPISIDSGTFKISDIMGFDQLNGKIVSCSHPSSDPVKTVRAIIEGVSDISNCNISGGLLTEEKVPKAYPMLSLADKIKNPGSPFTNDMVMTDLLTFSEQQIHVSFVAVMTYYELHGRYPNKSDVDEVFKIAKELISSGQIALEQFEVDEAICKKVASYSGFELQPLSAFVGGVLAQEVVKCTGKFTPIPGWLHFSAFETLMSEEVTDTEPRNTRYDDLASIFGWNFVEKLGNLKYFLVGCGALGCEFLKNFALNGICCGKEGMLVVTDADRIELSNLTRQFLFRETNVGQPKSKAGSAMVVKMNKDLKINALEQFVGKNTEHIFDDKFWMDLDGICNALDNMEARRYVDTQCVKYEKPLLESGTMGTSGNVDTIKPFSTKTYRDGGNAVEGGGIPMCTLRNFPHLTDHCIEWSRDQFELLFVKLAKGAVKYMESPDEFETDKISLSEAEPAQAIFETRCTLAFLKAAKNPTVGTIAQLSFDLFHMLFRDRILDLQAAFPIDSRMKDKEGNDIGPFWSEKKRYPTVANFNVNDESHWTFMASCTCLFGVILGIFPPKVEGDDLWLKDFRSPEWVKGLVESLSIPEYLNSPVKTDFDNDDNSLKGSKESVVVKILSDIRTVSEGLILKPMESIEFEKDDDLNFHISFITASANLRCDNYSIKRTEFHSCKVIAGKIIAAIATTTAAVCGLVILELFKLVQGKETNDLMLRQIGLAVNNYTSFTQDPPKKFSSYIEQTVPDHDELEGMDAFDEKGVLKDSFIIKTPQKAYPENHSVWDKLVCNGSLTLSEFVNWFSTEHKIIITSWDIVVGNKDNKPVTSTIYPPKPVLDPSLLPSIEITLQQATMAIMKTPAAKPTQQYIALWKEFKASGKVPTLQEDPNKITNETTLKEILIKIETLSDLFLIQKKIDQKNLTNISDRHFWLVPGEEAPGCKTIEGDNVASLASIKILLK